MNPNLLEKIQKVYRSDQVQQLLNNPEFVAAAEVEDINKMGAIAAQIIEGEAGTIKEMREKKTVSRLLDSLLAD